MTVMGVLSIVDARGDRRVFEAPDIDVAYAIMSVYGSVRRLKVRADHQRSFSITCGKHKVAHACIEIYTLETS